MARLCFAALVAVLFLTASVQAVPAPQEMKRRAFISEAQPTFGRAPRQLLKTFAAAYHSPGVLPVAYSPSGVLPTPSYSPSVVPPTPSYSPSVANPIPSSSPSVVNAAPSYSPSVVLPTPTYSPTPYSAIPRSPAPYAFPLPMFGERR